MEGKIKDPDKALQRGGRKLTYEYDACGNLTAVRADSLSPVKSYLWDEENRLMAANTNGSVSCYFYDAAGERTVKLSGETEMVHVNGKQASESSNIAKFTAYVSPYFQISNGGAYTKHIYSGSQRIASKLGSENAFGADPRRVEQAGGLKITDLQADLIEHRFAALGKKYEKPGDEDIRLDSTGDSEERERLTFFYHPDHLGSTGFVTDIDGNATQFISYIPYGEVFVEERNTSFSSSYLFNAKELDNETGLYYYGARYLDPESIMWLSVDPLWEKYPGISPYSYCVGNPVVLRDPDGKAPWAAVAFIVGGAVGGAVNGFIAYQQGKSESEIFAATVGGFVAGGIASAGSSVGAAAVSGAVGGAFGNAVEQAINVAFGNQESVDVKDVAVSAAVGSATNAGSTAVKNAISKGAVPKMKEVVSKEQKAFSESARKSRLYDCTKDSPDISTVKQKFVNRERNSRAYFKGQKEWVKFEKNTKRTATDAGFNVVGNKISGMANKNERE